MRRLPPKGESRVERLNTLLIDGNALFKRGYHGSHGAYNANGEHIGGIYQFITVLKMLLEKDVFHRVYVFWDGEFSGKLRYEIYKDYKSGRGKNYETGTEPVDDNEKLQRLIVKDYLDDLSIRYLEDEVVESDDFIAYYCLIKQENEDITICTSDRDLCQLISDDVKIYLCDKKEYITKLNYGKYFKHHPSNVSLIKTIAGDTSDSITGIKGVKEQTLLTHFPFITDRETTIDEIIEEAKKIQENRITNKKPPLKAIDNIINSVTDGKQGKDIFKINDELVNLKKPKITQEAITELYNLIDLPLSKDRDIKNVYNKIKRDGVDNLISDFLCIFL